MKNFERAAVLSEALPHMIAFGKRTVVVKYDNSVMQTDELKRAAISDIVLLSLVGVRVVVVHGDNPNMDCVGRNIVSLINIEGGKAVSLSGIDGSTVKADKTGIKSINNDLINAMLDKGYIPVISAIAEGVEHTNYSLNADTTAAELSVSLKSEKLILLTDKCGICEDVNDENTLISELRLSMVRPLIKKGAISDDMVHKLNCCVNAVRRGVSRAHILDGRLPHSILVEMLTDSGIGTMILAD